MVSSARPGAGGGLESCAIIISEAFSGRVISALGDVDEDRWDTRGEAEALQMFSVVVPPSRPIPYS
jgi:hypothetical protein